MQILVWNSQPTKLPLHGDNIAITVKNVGILRNAALIYKNPSRLRLNHQNNHVIHLSNSKLINWKTGQIHLQTLILNSFWEPSFMRTQMKNLFQASLTINSSARPWLALANSVSEFVSWLGYQMSRQPGPAKADSAFLASIFYCQFLAMLPDGRGFVGILGRWSRISGQMAKFANISWQKP